MLRIGHAAVAAASTIFTALHSGAAEISLGSRAAIDPFDHGSHLATAVVVSVAAVSPDRRATVGVLGAAGVLRRLGFDGSYSFVETGIVAHILPVGASAVRVGLGLDVTIIRVLAGFTAGTATSGLVAEWTRGSMGIRILCGPRVRVVFADPEPERVGGALNASFFWR